MNLFDAIYDYAAGHGLLWVRDLRVTTYRDDDDWWTQTHIEYVALDVGSKRARDEVAYMALMPEGLRAAYYEDFKRWQGVQRLTEEIERLKVEYVGTL